MTDLTMFCSRCKIVLICIVKIHIINTKTHSMTSIRFHKNSWAILILFRNFSVYDYSWYFSGYIDYIQIAFGILCSACHALSVTDHECRAAFMSSCGVHGPSWARYDVPDRLIYLAILIFDRKKSRSACAGNGTEVGCVRWRATKSAATLSIEIWLASHRWPVLFLPGCGWIEQSAGLRQLMHTLRVQLVTVSAVRCYYT